MKDDYLLLEVYRLLMDFHTGSIVDDKIANRRELLEVFEILQESKMEHFHIFNSCKIFILIDKISFLYSPKMSLNAPSSG